MIAALFLVGSAIITVTGMLLERRNHKGEVHGIMTPEYAGSIALLIVWFLVCTVWIA